MSKKLCSILLAFAMIMLTITNAFAAVQFENVEGSTFKIENLKELGFINGYEDGSLRLDQYIKRSEFAKVLVNAFDKEQEAEAIKGKFKPFKDVDESHWANGIISIVKNLKGVNNTQIINGYPDGTFRPEEHITNAEALKMLVCCVKADLTEGMYKNAEWFESWVKWAIELGIIGADTDVPNIVDMNAKVTRGNVFTMFYNAFEEDEVERPIEKTEEKEPEKKTEDKKEEKSVAPDKHTGSRHDRYDRYTEYPYYPEFPIDPFEPPVPEVKTYSISIDSSANGIVSADKYSAEEGEIVNLRIMPNPGYKLDSIEVTDAFGNNVHVVNQWFAMPSSNVVVTAKFVEETVEPIEFDKENIKNIEIKSEPSKMNYVEGEQLDLSGLVVVLTDINDNSVEVDYNDFLEYGIYVEPENETILGLEDNGIQIKVSKSGIEAKTNQIEVKEIEYNDDLFVSIEIISEPAKLSYTEKENLDLTGLKVKLTDTNGKTKEVELKEFADNGITTEPVNGDELTTSNNGQAVKVTKGTETVETNTFTVTELPYDDDLFASLEIITEPENLSYTEKENLDLTGLKVKLTDTNGKTKEVNLQDFGANGITTEPENEATLSLTDNGKAITVTKGEVTKTTTGKLEITELTYDDTKFASLEIINEPANLSYTEKEKLDLTGLKVKLTDSNGKTKEVELKDFEANKITTDPANGAALKTTDNGKAITVTKSSKTVETTKKLEVTELEYDDTKFDKLEIVNEPTKLSYTEKEKLDLTGLKVRLTDSNGKTKEVDQKDFANYNITTEPGNGDELKTTDSGKAISVKKASKTVETTNKLEVTELEYDDKKFESLEIIDEPENLSYTEKDKLDLTGLKVKLTDSNGKTKEVELQDFEANGLTTEPTDGAILNLTDNGKAISVT
ncbi:MAG: S-layer homology domain-containing protein, partial [Eubacteriales bacterium]|nr:S-layer homology domain-containing protein [Eubacteriales bacterium]